MKRLVLTFAGLMVAASFAGQAPSVPEMNYDSAATVLKMPNEIHLGEAAGVAPLARREGNRPRHSPLGGTGANTHHRSEHLEHFAGATGHRCNAADLAAQQPRRTALNHPPRKVGSPVGVDQ